MVRGRNPDGTPKRWPADDRRNAKRRHDPSPLVESVVNGITPPRSQRPDNNHWTQNPAIVRRLEVVEQYRLQGLSAYEISRATGWNPRNVMEDWDRLNDLWVARVGRNVETLRGEAVRRLDNVIRNGLEILRQDEAYTQAVLFNMPMRVTCAGRQEHRTSDLLLSDPLGQPTGTVYGDVFSCIEPHGMLKRVARDEKGAAQYRRVAGQVLQAINTAIMNQARIQGLVVEKKALTDGEGNDLPTALRTLLLGEELPDQNALPEAAEALDIGMA
jgi:hypothetical protein